MEDAAKDDGLLDVSALVQMFEDSEDASLDARENAERDRDYCDNIQYTAEELAEFAKRRQPPIIINRIKRKIDFLKGYEQSQRVNPRVLPRTLAHEADAEAAEKALIYVSDAERFDHKRSRVWDNLLVEGSAGYRVGVKKGYNGELCVTIDTVPWDRMFYDPHSSAPDFSDASYLGIVRWVDLSDALLEYPDGREMLEWTLQDVGQSQTYDDKPKYRVWADRKRKRVRICQIWVKRGEAWFFAEFTKGGILKAGPSPYQTDKGESDCELIFGSAYVNRDNDRYGIVREMIGPQDEINKRRSKALHLLNTNQIVYERGAVADIEISRREAARPDGTIELNPGGTDKFRMETRLDLAQAQMQLLQEAKTEIDMMAGNIAMQGNALQQSAASGKAIIASQQGGAMEIAPILDHLRDMDLRVFRAVWFRIRQFWTAEKWVRITDDERNIKWVGLNVDPRQVQIAAMQNPELAGKIAGVVQNLAELDCDIIIDDAPDGLTPQLEQWQSLVELANRGVGIPPDVLIKAAPNLRNKRELLDAMQQAAQQPQMDPAALKMQEIQANAQIKQQEMAVETQLKQQEMAVDAQLEREKMQLELQMQHEKMLMEAEMERMKVQASAEANVQKLNMEAQANLHRMEMEGATRNNLDAKHPSIRSNENLAGAIKELAAGTAAMQAGVMALIDAQNAETELVRDPSTGRAIGARKVRRQQEAANGRV